ncbi:YhgE/Pip N-terminal domain protein [Microbacterium sp. C448]|uniref:YhgE/Pip domain-containing protein n=1 Tax=Microbacterium sp. C448 TaxID=1177594 RepID=UPI0003DE561C|nr:YhgE/Pip family protein [Microbacterium sp. C448]CDK00222.1 YhgE/Pip N-terminal domain protein [Microbacterium sp. C448]
MTLPIERARSRRPVTWLTVLGVLLLPAVLGGILVTALYNPTERLDEITAAIVNDDEPVTVNDQYTPLGRQLSAGLVEGSDDLDSNLTWVLSNDEDAAEGLADGTYDAIVTIPSGFSAAATSSGQALADSAATTPEKAVIEVATSSESLLVDDAITSQVTQTAATVMGEQISTLTLENVFLSFTTLSDQIGQAADGAGQLADGAAQAAEGGAVLPSGATQLATGASSAASGAGELAGGLDTIAGGMRSSAGGAASLGSGITQIADQLSGTQLSQAANGASQLAAAVDAQSGGTTAALTQLVADCDASGASGAFCTSLQSALVSSSTTDAYADQLVPAAAGTAAGVGQITGPTSPVVDGLRQSASGATSLSSGLTQLADGTTASANGARGLQNGTAQLATGAEQLGAGAQTLVDGVGSLADGATSLADGLDEATAALPTYTDDEATSLATVLSNPVGTEGIGTSLFGASAIPLLSMAVLWFGGLATFVALRAATGRALAARESTVRLTLRAFLPAALLGAAQGLLVAIVAQFAASYDWGQWWTFAAVCMIAGVAFAAVNQALVAVLGGAGRWVAALVGVLALATGIVSTVPGPLASIAGLLPTAPAYHAMVGALTGAGGVTAGGVGLIAWGALSLIASMVVVAQRRSTSARALLAAQPA